MWALYRAHLKLVFFHWVTQRSRKDLQKRKEDLHGTDSNELNWGEYFEGMWYVEKIRLLSGIADVATLVKVCKIYFITLEKHQSIFQYFE